MELEGKLYTAAREGDEAVAQQLLAAGARAGQAFMDGLLPLHFASGCGGAAFTAASSGAQPGAGEFKAGRAAPSGRTERAHPGAVPSRAGR